MTPQILLLHDPSRPALDGHGDRPVRVHLWRAEAPSAPFVLLSHGTGGAAEDLAWWAEGLCAAGLDVAAVDHHGNTSAGEYVAEAFVWWWERPRDLSFVLDRVAARGPVGACGFSIGGYTVAAVCGARIDAAAYRGVLTGHVDAPPTPEYPGLREELAVRHSPAAIRSWVGRAAADHSDTRVRAGFLLCPGFGPLLTGESLARIRVPVAVRWTAADEIVPAPQNGVRYVAGVPGADGGVVGTPTSGHYGFVIPAHDDPLAKADALVASMTFFGRTLSASGGAPAAETETS